MFTVSQNNIRCVFAVVFMLASLGMYAVEFQESDSTKTSAQLRLSASFSTKLTRNLSFSAEEEVRFDDFVRAFDRSYTTVEFRYRTCDYLKVGAGYTLMLLGGKGTSDYNEFLRHRVYADVAGNIHLGQWKLTLRERGMLTMRTDSVNPLEKKKNEWILRSKLQCEYTVRTVPLKPYAYIELSNTLNAPKYEPYYGGNYIDKIRASVGLKYRINAGNSLNFYYRFDRNYDRDINITKKKGNVELLNCTTFNHIIGIAYDFDW